MKLTYIYNGLRTSLTNLNIGNLKLILSIIIFYGLPYRLDRMGFIENDRICVLGIILTNNSRFFFNHNHTYGWNEKFMSSLVISL